MILPASLMCTTYSLITEICNLSSHCAKQN